MFWVQYFEYVGKNNWTLGDRRYTAIETDVSSVMAAPSLVMRGSRFYYR